jgi:hypothetical protein
MWEALFLLTRASPADDRAKLLSGWQAQLLRFIAEYTRLRFGVPDRSLFASHVN